MNRVTRARSQSFGEKFCQGAYSPNLERFGPYWFGPYWEFPYYFG